MTKDEALETLRKIADESISDPEAYHHQADVVLCKFLIELGHQDIVRAWDAVHKWYA